MEENIVYNTREEWLESAIDFFRPSFEAAERPLPAKVRVSIGFPPKGGLGTRKQVLGVCTRKVATADEVPQIYINPVVQDVGGPIGYLAILVHELVHATGIEKHGADFKKVAYRVGLEGKAASTTATDTLQKDFETIMDRLGVFPHATINPHALMGGGKKQGTRMLKAECKECGYTIRLSKKWADVGVPACICGAQLELDEKSKAEENDSKAD